MRRRLLPVAIAILFGMSLGGARTWQTGALGVGFLAIGIGVLVQRRRARRSEPPGWR